MKIYKRRLLKYIIITIIVILFLSSNKVIYAENNSADLSEKAIVSEEVILDQILYSLEIIDITDSVLSKNSLNKLAYINLEEDREFNLIKRDELLEILGDNFEAEIDAGRGKKYSRSVFIPQIVVIPHRKGILRAAQEELFLDVESVDSIIYTNIFELIVEAKNNYDNEKNAVLTDLQLATGDGPTALETEVWIEKDKAYLLGVMENYREKTRNNIADAYSENKRRYFALYLSARPAGILSLSDLSASLYGMNQLFLDSEIENNKSEILVKFNYENNSHSKLQDGLSLQGFIKNEKNTAISLNINETLSNRHTLALLGKADNFMWLGAEIIALEDDQYHLALKLMDEIDLKFFKLSAAVNPLVYYFDNDLDKITWSFRGESAFSQKINFALEYKALEKYDFAEVNIDYGITDDYHLITGYTLNLDLDDEESIWMGLNFKF
jgi:hypothetical protein